MRQLTLSITAFFCIAMQGYSQDSLSVNWRIEHSYALSYTGLSASLTPNLTYGKWEFYVGPKLVISDTYGMSDAALGGVLGARFYPNSSVSRFHGFASADFQHFQFSPSCVGHNCPESDGQIVEASFGYGFRMTFGKRWAAISSIHYGIYKESFSNQLFEDEFVTTGTNGMFRLGVQYQISNR